MHYYSRNIGDYYKKAGRLSILQHGVYNLLIDACYDREEFPRSIEDAIDWIWASTPDERHAVEFVLTKFFQFDGQNYIQKRIQDELFCYQKRKEIAAQNGKKGGRPKKPKTPEKKPNGFSEKANQSELLPKKSLTNNQLTINHNNKKNITKKRAAKIPENWVPDEALVKAIAGKHSCSEKVVYDESETFRDYWLATGKPMIDWRAAFRNWCKRDYCAIHKKTTQKKFAEFESDYDDEPAGWRDAL